MSGGKWYKNKIFFFSNACGMHSNVTYRCSIRTIWYVHWRLRGRDGPIIRLNIIIIFWVDASNIKQAMEKVLRFGVRVRWVFFSFEYFMNSIRLKSSSLLMLYLLNLGCNNLLSTFFTSNKIWLKLTTSEETEVYDNWKNFTTKIKLYE